MAEDRGDEQTGSASTDDLAARLAEVHRRTEELAAQVASFHAETAQLTGQTAQSSQAPQGDQAESDERAEPTEQPEPPESERRHRPRPSPDAPRVYDDAEPESDSHEQQADEQSKDEPAKDEPAKDEPAKDEPAKDEPAKDDSGDGEAKVDTSQLEEEIDAALAAPKYPGGDDGADRKDGKSAVKDGDADGPEKDGKAKDGKRKRRGLGKWGGRIRKLAIIAVIIVAGALALRTWVVAPYYVPSASMEPTLHGCPSCNDDHLLVQKLSYDFHDPQRGDIVVFDKPSSWKVSESVLIKRVIGVPGDRIVIKHQRVFVNGQRLEESYVKKSCHGTPSYGYKNGSKVPKGDLFVMGDNRCNSDDSRQQGPVPIDNVVGKAFLIIWPFSRFGSP